MPLHLIRHDITLMKVDAIVNAANNALEPGGGVDGAIHRAAGPGLLAECRTLGGCKTGEAKITSAYNLPCRYVIHTVGPVWRGGLFGEKRLLAACYRHSLEAARERGCTSIAFPLLSSGAFGYPKEKALRAAVDAISAFLLQSDADMTVYLVLFTGAAVRAGSKLTAQVQQYIDDHYVEEHAPLWRERRRMQAVENAVPDMCMTAPSMASLSLEEMLHQVDESFSEMVARTIKEKGMKNADCYKKANLDKKHFSKLINDAHYKPKKTTALAIAIALELDMAETRDLLMKAGYALSRSDKADIVVEYFITNGRYDIFEINEVLFDYDLPLLGSVMI